MSTDSNVPGSGPTSRRVPRQAMQRVRPSAAELSLWDDDEQNQTQGREWKQSMRRGVTFDLRLDQEEEQVTDRPAAKVFRVIRSEAEEDAASKVEQQPRTQVSSPHTESIPASSFTATAQGSPSLAEPIATPSEENPQSQFTFSGLIGSVSERRPAHSAYSQSLSKRSVAYPSSSSTSATAAASSTRATQIRDAPHESFSEPWLDESGKPMSAFRKKRLMQQGHTTSPFAPLSFSLAAGDARDPRERDEERQTDQEERPIRLLRSDLQQVQLAQQQDLTRDPGGGAGPEAMMDALAQAMDTRSAARSHPRAEAAGARVSAGVHPSSADTSPAAVLPPTAQSVNVATDQEEQLLEQISRENEDKVRGMTPEQVEKEVKSLETMFGKDVLRMLSERRKLTADGEEVRESRTTTTTGDQNVPAAKQGETPKTHRDASHHQGESAGLDSATAIATKAPEAAEPHTLHFHPHQHSTDPAEPRFTAQGNVAAGQGPGERGDKLSFFIDQIMTLARSTSPTQRRQALDILANVLRRHEPKMLLLASDLPASRKDGKEEAEPWCWLVKKQVHVRAAMTAAWMLSNPSPSTQSAALSVLRQCLATLPLVLAVVQTSATSSSTADGSWMMRDLASVINELLAFSVIDNLTRFLLYDRSAHLNAFEPDACARSSLLALIQLSSNLSVAADVMRRETFLTSTIASIHPPPTWFATQAEPDVACESALEISRALVRSSKDHAEQLVDRPAFYAALSSRLAAAWRFETTDGGDQVDHEGIWRIIVLILDLLADLAEYGLIHPHIGLHWELLNSIAWRTDKTVGSEKKACLRLCRILTICAGDPHVATKGGHDIVWDVVKGWVEASWHILEAGLEREDSWRGEAWGCAALHVHAFLSMVKKHTRGSTVADTARLKSLQQRIDLATAAQIELEIKRYSDRDLSSVARSGGNAAVLVGSLSGELRSLLGLLKLSEGKAAITNAATLIASLTRALPKPHSAVTVELRETMLVLIVELASVALEGSSQLNSWIDALYILVPGEEQLAERVLQRVLQKSPHAAILGPFVQALVTPFPDAAAPLAGITFTPAEIAQNRTLNPLSKFVVPKQAVAEEDVVDVDPVTSSPFWKSPANRLPLRRDWAFSALDELLHSGNSAVLNRPGSLPPSWDYNERDIVFATLSLASTVLGCTGPASPMISSAEIWLNVIKVYLLEGTVHSAKNSTGALTGRDLFRDPGIGALLRKLMDLAVTQQRTCTSDTVERMTMQQATLRIFGPEMTFYQLYTDLLGVYDTSSFGDENFKRAVLHPLSMAFETDYRRLFWNDFAHLLPTITMTPEQVVIESYLHPIETDRTTLELYAAGLLSDMVQPQRNPLLFAIASHHLAAFFWTYQPTESKDLFSKRLFRTVFGSQTDVGRVVQKTMFDSQGVKTLEERKRFVENMLKQ